MPRARMTDDVKERLRATLTERSGSASARITEQVRRWIFDGLLRDGDVVSQEELADLFGVSRIPVRDALISLAAVGWISLEPGVGAYAVGLNAPDIRDSFELMGTIWALLARRVVEHDGDERALAAAAARIKAAASADDVGHANEEFLTELRRLAGSTRLDAAFRGASRIVSGDFFTVVPGAVDAQRHHVPRIYTAIRRRDTDRAAELSLALHRTHAHNVTQLLTAAGVIG